MRSLRFARVCVWYPSRSLKSHIIGEQERYLLFELGEVSAIEGNNMHVTNRMRLEAVRQNFTRRWSSP